MKHIGTKILAGVLVVLLAGAGVLIWRNLPEDAPRLQEPEETVRQEPEVQPDTTATLCVAGDIVAHMPLVADAWNGEAYDFTHLFADARPYYEAADYTTACLETTFNGPPYSGYPQFCAPDALASGLKTVGFHLLSAITECGLDTRAMPAIFMGGGAALLKRRVSATNGLCRPVILDDVSLNAKGYERLVRQMSGSGAHA